MSSLTKPTQSPTKTTNSEEIQYKWATLAFQCMSVVTLEREEPHIPWSYDTLELVTSSAIKALKSLGVTQERLLRLWDEVKETPRGTYEHVPPVLH